VSDVEPTGTRDALARARTHLANERTFLAWLRTGVSLIALGLAAAQFLTRGLLADVPLVRGLATLLVLAGILATAAGGARYLGNVQRIERGEFAPGRHFVAASAALVLLVGILALAFIYALHG
jgi:putative membrane protein